MKQPRKQQKRVARQPAEQNPNHRPPVLVRPSQTPGSPRPIILAMIALFGFAGLMLLVCLTMLAVYAYYQVTGVILPGVQVGNTRLQGLSVLQAAAELDKTWNTENLLLVTSGIQTRSVTPSELGLTLNANQTAQNAHEIGHGGSVVDEFMQLLVCIIEGWQVTPVVSFDEEVALSGLQAINPHLSTPARNATVQLLGDKLEAVPGVPGYTIDIEATFRILSADPKSVFTTEEVQVILVQVQPEITDVSGLIEEAQVILYRPLTIQAYDALSDETFEWQVPHQELAGWLQFNAGAGGAAVVIDPQAVSAYLDQLSTELKDGRFLDARRFSQPLAEAIREGAPPLMSISHTATKYMVKPGDTLLKIGWNLGIPFWMILDANPGLTAENLWAGMEITIPSKDELLPLPIIANKRIVISISKQRLWAYQDKALLHQYPISTGIDRSPTQPGIFQVQTHEPMAYASVWDLYMPNFMGVYEAWPDFMNGMHGLPTLSSGQRLWANILGRPASYGCIILDLDAAEWLYNWAENGVVVEITP